MAIDCKHWSPHPTNDKAGLCAIRQQGGEPMQIFCPRCPKNTERVGVLGCSGCGGGNAVRDVAKARTPQQMEQAILDA
jgi:hypothetical protein